MVVGEWSIYLSLVSLPSLACVKRYIIITSYSDAVKFMFEFESSRLSIDCKVTVPSIETGWCSRFHRSFYFQGTPERLMLQLVEENSIDPTYVEDFLLTHRTFIDSSIDVAQQLLEWFAEPTVRDRVTRVVLLWVNNHFTDFETDPAMMEFLETFEAGLEREKMQGQVRVPHRFLGFFSMLNPSPFRCSCDFWI